MEEKEHEIHSHSHNSDLFDCIRTRRSVRKYKDKPIPWDNVVEVLQAGKYAPFAGNVFNVKFLVIKDENRRKAIAEACAQQYWVQDAPIQIVVVGEPEKAERYYGTRGARVYTLQSAGAAIQNMLLTAHALGLGACWVGAFDEGEIINICNIPEHLNVQAVITLGYADEVPIPPPKLRVEHVMFFEKWFGRVEAPKTAIGMWSPYIQKAVKETHKMIKKHANKLVEKSRARMKNK
ncbi:nitroreductase family protein [Candidatus Woesearchaeota archaeon]|nr:nitroreductase family protein [Candidatus Woesearchaeota archaeon]